MKKGYFRATLAVFLCLALTLCSAGSMFAYTSFAESGTTSAEEDKTGDTSSSAASGDAEADIDPDETIKDGNVADDAIKAGDTETEFELVPEEDAPQTDTDASAGEEVKGGAPLKAPSLKASNSGQSTIEDGDGAYHGVCGDGLTWTLTADKILTISGTGRMYDFNWRTAPWNKSAGNITDPLFDAQYKEIIIQDGVESIGNWAFAEQTKITGITLPDSIEYIGANAFNGCSQLVNVVLPSSLNLIEERAFCRCGIPAIILPEGVQTVEKEAFLECEHLGSISLPKTLKTFRGSALAGTNCLTLGPESGSYDVEIPWGGKNGNIPSGVNFGDEDNSTQQPRTSKSPIVSVTVPDGITELNASFTWMQSLKNIKLPDSLTTLNNAFNNCDALQQVDLSKYNNIEVIAGTFSDCDSLETAILPDQAQLKGDVFSNCKSLTSVHLPDSAAVLSNGLFSGCKSLTGDSFNWPSAAAYIGSEAFAGCTVLDELVLPDSIEYIGDHAFLDCGSLAKIYIPESVKKGTVTEDDPDKGVHDLKYGPFEGCHALISAGPEGDTKYTYNIEYGWKTSIPKNIFRDSDIQAITFPDTMEKLEESCLSGSDKLKKVMLPASLKEIGTFAFADCKTLSLVRMPEDISRIEYGAFTDCPKLKKMMFRGDAPYLSGYVFGTTVITAYYPGSNSTWTADIVGNESAYGDDVTFQPYNTDGPFDPATEHDVTINNAGTAKVRFYLVDKNGKVIPEARFKYIRHGGGRAEEMDNEFIMTDIDGGYDFQTTYLEAGKSTVTEDVWFDNFELLSNEAQELGKTEFTIHATVAPRAYTESWELGLGHSLSIESILTGSRGNKAQIEMVHNSDGTQDLNLKLTIDDSIKTKLVDFNIIDPDEFTIGDLSLSGAESYLTTYTHIIKNYSPDKESHRKEATDFIGLALLSNNILMEINGFHSKTGAIFEKALIRKVREDYAAKFNDYFDKTSETAKTSVSASSSKISFKNPATGEVLGSTQLYPVSGSTDYTFTNSIDPLTKVTSSSTGIKTSSFSALLSDPITGLAGVKGFYGREKLNDASVAVDRNGKITLKTCSFDSGFNDTVGWGDIYQYHSMSVGGKEAKPVVSSSELLTNLTTSHFGIFSMKDYKQILGSIAENDSASTWSDTEKLTNAYKIEPTFKLAGKPKGAKASDSKEPSLKYKASLSFAHSWNTEMMNGTILGGKPSITVDSSGAADIMRDASYSSTLATAIGTPVDGLLGTLEDVFDYDSGNGSGSISVGSASLKTAFSASSGLTISLIRASGEKETISSAGNVVANSIPQSLSIKAVPKKASAGKAGADGSEDAVTARTIGDAFCIVAEDADGNEVTDLSAGSPQITVSYSDAELEAASCTNTADAIGLYHFDESTGNYSFVECTVDTTAKTVKANITETGQYILATDGGASVSGISTENGLSAVIASFTGIKSAEVLLDDTAILTSSGQNSFAKYYNNETGELSYPDFSPSTGNHTLVFRITGNDGNESVTEHPFTVVDAPSVSDVSTGDSTWFGGDIRIKARVSSNMDDVSDVNVWADVTMKTDEDSEEEGWTDQCQLIRDGDYWTGTFRARRPYKYYEFTVSASDDYGRASAATVSATLEESGSATVDGVKYIFSRNSGTIKSAEITGDNITEVTVPDSIGGIPVRNIGASAFENCTGMSKLVISEGIRVIGTHAFENCSGLKEVALPESLRGIESYAFYNCTELKTVTIPESVEYVGKYAIGYEEGTQGKPDPTEGVTVNAEPGTAGAAYVEQLIKDQTGGGESSEWTAYTEDEVHYLIERSVMLRVSIRGDAAGLKYNWYDGDGNLIAENAAAVRTVYAAGDYYCDVTDGSRTERVDFTVVDASGSEFEAYAETSRIRYEGSPVQLKVITSGGTGNFTYTWCIGNTTDYNINPIEGAPDSNVYTVNAPGRYVCEVNDEYDNYNQVEFYVVTDSDDVQPSDGGGSTPSGSGGTSAGTANNAQNAAAAAETARQGILDPKLPKVKISKPKAAKKAVTVKWKKLTKKNQKKAKRIEIWVCPNKAFGPDDTVIKTTSKKKASLKVKKLKAKKKYYIKVRTVKYAGGVKYVSKWSKVKKVKIR